jgi:hypothetical protein
MQFIVLVHKKLNIVENIQLISQLYVKIFEYKNVEIVLEEIHLKE